MADPKEVQGQGSLTRRDFLKVTGFTALSGIPNAIDALTQPPGTKPETPTQMQLLMEALDRNDPRVVTEMIKLMKIIPESVVRYRLDHYVENGNGSWNFSFVSRRPDLLLRQDVRFEYAWTHFHEPPFAQVNFKGLQLTQEQSDSLHALLGGKKKSDLAGNLISGGFVVGGVALAASGVKDMARGKVGRGLAETGLGLTVAATGVVSNEKLYKSLPLSVQKPILTAAKVMPLNYLVGCTGASPTDVPNLTPPQTQEAGTDSGSSPTPGSAGTQPENTSIPPPREATPFAEPPGREVAYPSNTSGFLWDYDNSPPNVMSTLTSGDYAADTNNIEKFYNAVVLQEGMDGSQVDFVGSLGPKSWVIAMKFQGEFYVLKEKEGLLLSAITPFAVLDQDPAGYTLVKVKLDSLPPKADGSRYTHDDLRIYVDESKYHVIAVDGGKFYLDLTSDQWKDQNGNPVGTVEVLPTESSASFETGQWAEKEDGTLSPEKMFQLVGAIDYKHHKVVDLSYNGLKVAVVTGEDLTQKDASGFDDEKNTQADQINSNINLKAQLDLVRPQLDQNNLDKYTIVVENGAIKWIVDQSSDIPFYQKFENNKLVEVEVQLLPELRVNGPYIERADTGEKVQFAGGALVFIPEAAFYPETLKPFDSLYEFVKYYVEMAKSNDINLNIVRLGYDTKDVQEKPEEFEKTVRYLETQGIYVILDPHYANGEFLLFPTEDILEGQRKLASILKTRRNLIFGLQNEIGATAMKTYTWSDWAPWITKISDAIYENYQDQNGYKPIILVAGPEWNRDFRNAKIPISNYAIDLHQYKVWDSYEGGPMHEVDWWSQMIGNVPIFITENGALQMPPDDPWAEDLEFVENTLNTVSGHPFLIHYVLFMMSSGEGGNMFNQWKKGELTPKGLLYKNSQSTQKYTDFSD